MSEEKEVVEQDGTWSGIKKTIIGVASTAILGVGTWATTKLTGGGEEKGAPAQPSIIINNTQQQQQAAANGGKTVVIKEAAKPAQPAPAPKKKEGDEFKEKPAQW